MRFLTMGPFSFSIGPGECVCLTGPSGTGKSLILKSIADIIPHDGNIFLGDAESRQVPAYEWRRRICLLPPESQWWHDKVGRHFTPNAYEYIQKAGFSMDVLDWEITRLSSGEKQRLALARVFAAAPLALLLDEPTSNLDVQNVKLAEDLILSYMRDKNVSVLWVSHNMEQISRVASRALTLKDFVLTEERLSGNS